MPKTDPEPFEPNDESDVGDQELDELEARLREQLKHDPLFTKPPHPGPIPEVLRQPSEFERRRQKVDYNDAIRSRLFMLSGLGTEFVIAVVVMGGIGWALDKWLKTSPWCLLVGIGLGLLYGTVRFVKRATAAVKSAEDEERSRGDRQPFRGQK